MVKNGDNPLPLAYPGAWFLILPSYQLFNSKSTRHFVNSNCHSFNISSIDV